MRVLVATGGAPHSDVAVRLGAYIAAMAPGSLTCLTVVRHERERAQADAILTRATLVVAPAGADVTTRIRVGHPAGEIWQEAASGDYDLLVVGDRPEHSLLRRLLGPTTERLLERLPCPLLVARNWQGTLSRLLLCEGGQNAAWLPHMLAEFAPLLAAATQVTVLHVMSQIAARPGVPGWELRADAPALIAEHTPEGDLLARDVAALQQVNQRVAACIRHGLVVDEILAEAAANEYDLLVLGAHRGQGWTRLLLDDLAHQVVTQADRSVLVT